MMKLCLKCDLGYYAKRQVEARGSSSSKILIIVDNPTKTDETIGHILSGKEGKLLDTLFQEAFKILNILPLSYFIIPMISCRPTDEKHGESREPKQDEVLACMHSMLSQIVGCKYKYIFLLGKTSHSYYAKEFPEAVKLQSMKFLVDDGGRGSSWYLSNLRLVMEGLK